MIKNPGLRDMEEMLSLVSDPAIEDYLREAFTCYGTGAYRACIVLTFIATFEDLRAKVRAHSTLSKEARTISAEIELLANGQKPFENTMVERLQSNQLISALQGQKLKQIIDHRNKAAHPSGHHASAEEARFVYTECIDIFLSQPVVNPDLMVDELIGRMRDGNFFPTTSVEKNLPVFMDEINNVNEKLYPKLFSKLAELVKSGDANEKRNARFFIVIAAGLKESRIREAIRKNILEKKVTDEEFSSVICEIISADGNSIDLVSDGCLRRIVSIMLIDAKKDKSEPAQTSLRHPIRVMYGVINSKQGEEFIRSGVEYIDHVINKYLLQPYLIRALKNNEYLKKKLLNKIVDRAGSSSFEEANEFSIYLPDIDEEFAKAFEAEDAFRVVSAVLRAAETGAFRAKDVRASSFKDCSEIKKKAAIFADENEQKAKKLLVDAGVEISFEKLQIIISN